MIKKVWGEELKREKRSVLKALGIPFFYKDGCYYHKETGEKL